MPVFKFSVPANAGEILVRLGVEGADAWNATGEILLSGRVVVLGQQVGAKGNGNIVVPLLSVSGQSETASCSGDVAVRCDILGYSSGADAYRGSGSLIFYPFNSIVLDGDAVLNGVCNGAVLLRRTVAASGRQGARGALMTGALIDGFGTRRACEGDIVAQLVAVSGSAEQEDPISRVGYGAIRTPRPVIRGRGGYAVERELSGTGSFLVGRVTVMGFSAPVISGTDDAVLKYEARRREM